GRRREMERGVVGAIVARERVGKNTMQLFAGLGVEKMKDAIGEVMRIGDFGQERLAVVKEAHRHRGTAKAKALSAEASERMRRQGIAVRIFEGRLLGERRNGACGENTERAFEKGS